MRTRLALALVILLAAARPAGADDAPRRVLFIGNSYTFVNNVPALVEAFSRHAGGPPIEAEMLVAPGALLTDFVEAGTVLERLGRESWDVVVLQELGGHPPASAAGSGRRRSNARPRSRRTASSRKRRARAAPACSCSEPGR
jgi:hypothetical protein